MATDGTVRSMQKDMGTVDHHREKGFYQQIVEHMLQAGYKRSSAWCFSRDQGMIDEYIVEQEEYLGLGSGAFSYLGGSIYASTFSINHYLKLVGSGQTGIVRQRSVNAVDSMRYYLMMRMFGGSLDLSEAEEKFNGDFARSLRAELTGLRLIGAISGDERQLKLTERGYYIWVIMMREFFTGVNNLREEMRLNISSESEMFTGGVSERGDTDNEQSRSATAI
jgi:coproporphyrinogen III oxidase-like Fe-S oxidoreductase